MIDTHTTIKPILKYPGAKSGFQATDYILDNRLLIIVSLLRFPLLLEERITVDILPAQGSGENSHSRKVQ